MDLVPSCAETRTWRWRVVENTGLIGVLRFNFTLPHRSTIPRSAGGQPCEAGRTNATSVMRRGWGQPQRHQRPCWLFLPQLPVRVRRQQAEFQRGARPGQTGRSRQTHGFNGENVGLSRRHRRRTPWRNLPGRRRHAQQDRPERCFHISTDWGTVVQRIQRKQSIAEGGWSVFGLMWGGYDRVARPAMRCCAATVRTLGPAGPRCRADRRSAINGYAPDMCQLEGLAKTSSCRHSPTCPAGLYYQPVAYQERSDEP